MHLSTIFGYDVIALADSGVTYFCVCKCRFGTKEKLSNSLETVVNTLGGALECIYMPFFVRSTVRCTSDGNKLDHYIDVDILSLC